MKELKKYIFISDEWKSYRFGTQRLVNDDRFKIAFNVLTWWYLDGMICVEA